MTSGVYLKVNIFTFLLYRAPQTSCIIVYSNYCSWIFVNINLILINDLLMIVTNKWDKIVLEVLSDKLP